MKRFTCLVLNLMIFSLVVPLSLYAASARSGWMVQWEKTVEAAKKEGQVTVYISGWGAVLDSGVFQKAYPGIKVVVVSGRGSEVSQRLLAERRAGRNVADVSSMGEGSNHRTLFGAGVFDPIKPVLLLPEVIDESKWYGGKHGYLDYKSAYVFKYAGTPTNGSFFYNTNLVDPKEFKSLWDFTKPKWKGKILVRDMRVRGPGNNDLRFFYHNPDLGPKYISKLFGEMDVKLFRGYRQATDWLARGRYPLCFACPDVDKAKNQGLPVDEFGPMIEGGALGVQFGSLGLLNNAPHPNAAKVFINWFLSREGQLTLQKAVPTTGRDAPDSRRIDISKDSVSPRNRRIPGGRYMDLETPERLQRKWNDILKIYLTAIEKGKK